MATTMKFTTEKVGFTSVKDLMNSLVTDLTANGMTRVYPTAAYDGSGVVMLDPTTAVDPLYTPEVAGQNPTSWRIAFKTDGETIQCNVATPIQLKKDGTISTAAWTAEQYNPGELGVFNGTETTKFVDRSHLTGVAGSVYPMSYIISISDHGIFIGIWDQSTDEYQTELNNVSPSFRWVLVQRPVTHDTGNTVVDGRQPVFCVFTLYEDTMIPRTSVEPIPPGQQVIVNGVYYKQVTAQVHKKFTVRESDILRPSLSRPADQNTEDSAAILNSTYQVSVSEDNRYVVTIPKGLNTTRYAYTHELDMIAYTSADVVGQWSEIELDVYGGQKYLYKSLLANRIKNTGMRLLCRVKPAADGTVTP